MGKKAKRRDAEQFSLPSIATAESFAAWLGVTDALGLETVSPYTILGLSAVLRSVSVISTTIADLPLRTYERQGDDRIVMPSVFDDPFPGIDGQTPFEWKETVLIHLLLWREAFLWHDDLDSEGRPSIYRPIVPDRFSAVERVNGRRVFKYNDPATGSTNEVDSTQVTYIPGPSIDAARGHPWLYAARHIFSAALAGDKSAATTLSRGIRLAGLLTPGEGEDIDPTEGEELLKQLRPNLLGSDRSGDIAFINKRLKLDPWTPTNVESQWHEARTEVIGEMGRLFGMPPHLLNDTEKQTSWGTGVAEQNLGLARYTLRGWSTRMQERLSIRLPEGPVQQFLEFDYKGLLQGTPQQENELLLAQYDAGVLTLDEVRKVMNLAPLTAAQKAEIAIRTAPPATPTTLRPVREPAA
jgi:HK97 family phage portal protein